MEEFKYVCKHTGTYDQCVTMYDWCQENIGIEHKDWKFVSKMYLCMTILFTNSFHFKNEEDAVMFKLAHNCVW